MNPLIANFSYVWLLCAHAIPTGRGHQRDAHRQCSPGHDDRHVYPAGPTGLFQVLGVVETSRRGIFVELPAARVLLRAQHRSRKGKGVGLAATEGFEYVLEGFCNTPEQGQVGVDPRS